MRRKPKKRGRPPLPKKRGPKPLPKKRGRKPRKKPVYITVLFRRFPDKEVIALFPEIPEIDGCCLSYTIANGFAPAEYEFIIYKTVRASIRNYQPVKGNLYRLGYRRLEIKKRYRPLNFIN